VRRKGSSSRGGREQQGNVENVRMGRSQGWVRYGVEIRREAGEGIVRGK
jgi:hypothetical protein